MQAAYIEEHGGPEVVRVGDLPAPEPGPGEVAIRLRTAALNHLDIWVRGGIPGIEQTFPHVLGSDGAGVVAEVGEGVDRVAVGDEVVIDPGLSCGRCEFCTLGEHSRCLEFHLVGEHVDGTMAERVVVPEPNCHPKPAFMTWEEAAAFPLTFVTAWRMLVTRAELRPGEDLLVHGIGGGVATAALLIGTRLGARVVVTSSSEEKLATAARLGAAHGIDYGTDDVVDAVRDLTGKRGVDVVCDSVGGDVWATGVECLRRGGRLVSCGATAGAEATLDVRRVFWKQVSILGSTMGSRGDFRAMLRFVEVNEIGPVVDETYPLDEVGQALARMEAGEQLGKLVVAVPEGS